MLKETETEETIVFFVTFLSLVAFQWGDGPPGPGYAIVLLPQTFCMMRTRWSAYGV